jgi:hypothetical protein
MFLRNVSVYLQVSMALQHRRPTATSEHLLYIIFISNYFSVSQKRFSVTRADVLLKFTNFTWNMSCGECLMKHVHCSGSKCPVICTACLSSYSLFAALKQTGYINWQRGRYQVRDCEALSNRIHPIHSSHSTLNINSSWYSVLKYPANQLINITLPTLLWWETKWRQVGTKIDQSASGNHGNG